MAGRRSIQPVQSPLIGQARQLLDPCRVCPRACQAHRLRGREGFCRAKAETVVASAGAHFGEEAVLVGPGGSGTIFLAGCNLRCVFCQNSEISQTAAGRPVSPEGLARIMLGLEDHGCGNINFVSPTHVGPAVLEAILLARHNGLTVPVVYNCGGYESPDMLHLLGGLVQIYLPDIKYGTDEAAHRYSDVTDYVAVSLAALAEMYRQVGPLEVDADGLAVRGLLVRHLVLPADMAQSRAVIDAVAGVAPGCTINIMAQYRPAHRAAQYPELLLVPARQDVSELRRYAVTRGLTPV